MYSYLFVIFILFAAYFLYSWIIKPKKLIKAYVKQFTNAGYKVKEYPINVFGAPYFQSFGKAAK